MKSTADVVICGAGIAGISVAYHLAIKQGIRDILLVDERPALSLTSDKSTECYRNWWPGPGDAMVSLMNRSIDLMEDLARQSGNVFRMNRRGYLFMTAEPGKVDRFRQAALEPPRLGAGELRIHDGRPGAPIYQPAALEGFEDQPTGADLILDAAILRQYFPYLSQKIAAALHVRRAGWLSAQQLGMYLLEQARKAGVRTLTERVTQVSAPRGKIESVGFASGQHVTTQCFVNAAGPYLNEVAGYIGVELPVYNELHLKTAYHDPMHVIDRNAPLLIWTDPQTIRWSPDEAELLREDGMQWLLEEMPSDAHTRPDGGLDSDIVLMLWEYRLHETEPVWPPILDELYPDLVLRGLVPMIPGLGVYLQKARRPVMDGGYYTKTRENRAIIGPLPLDGAYVMGALSGYGVMAACAAAELLAAYITGGPLPSYAAAFALERYADPAYVSSLSDWGDSGQL